MNGLITQRRPNKKILTIVKNLLFLIPNTVYFNRNNYKMRQIFLYFRNNKLETLFFLKQRGENSVTLWQINLKRKFSIAFKVISFLPKENLPTQKSMQNYFPEIIMKKFRGNTGKFLSSIFRNLFSSKPDLKGRQVLCFFFEKNYILVRFFRYIFSGSRKDVKLQEIGPRFSLGLLKIQDKIACDFFFL